MEGNVRKRICMYVKLGHFVVQQELAEHYKSTVIKNKY